GTITADGEFDALLSGTANFPESFLDAAQALLPGGLRQAELVGAKYLVQVRSGATGDSVELGPDDSMLSPGRVRLCNFPTDQVCTDGSECAGTICNPEKVLVNVPVSEDCTVGGVCDGLGKLEGETSQCTLNSFCVSGALDLPLLEETGTYTADASGEVLFGWADQGLTNNTFDSGTNLYTIPKPTVGQPLQQGLTVAAGLTVTIECVMGVDEGEDPGNADNTLVGVTPDTDLVSFPITP
ncbi:MAG: hypothetical protein WBM46_09380, partial [Polyangiales bacterium]